MKTTTMTTNLSGRVAVITGAASGMGRATAVLLSQAGASVALCDIQSCESVADEINRQQRSEQQEVLCFKYDARCKESIKELRNKILKGFNNQVDILINNAGVLGFLPFDADDDDYEEIWKLNFDVNVTSQQRLSRALLPALKGSNGGNARIVNIASTEGLGATIFNSCYVAAKHACIGLSKAMAVELGSQGITVNAICPGPIRTAMTEAISENEKKYFSKRLVPLRRYGLPEEVAYIVLCLVDPHASFINGAVINVDGGIMSNNALLPFKLYWEDSEPKVRSKL